MKKLSLLLNLIFGVALIGLLINYTLFATEEKPLDMEAPQPTNQTLETIFTRTSVRNYTSQEVKADTIELLLRAAMSAPTAVNKQPWAFIVVDDRALLDSLAGSLPYASMLREAGLAIIVCGDTDKALLEADQAYWVQDCSAASENLLLAAHAMGLGAVWTGVFPRPERVEAVRQILTIPAHLVPLNVIPVGYPEGESTPKDKWKPENIYRNRF